MSNVKAVPSEGTKRAWAVSKLAMDSLAKAIGTDKTFRYPIKAPELPPGVVPKGQKFALDSNYNQQLFSWASGNNCLIGFPGYQWLAELAQRSEYRAPAETIAQEMTRMWIKLESTGEGDKSEKITEIEKAFKDFGVQALFRRMAETDGLFGRAQAMVLIKGQEGDAGRALPLTISKEGVRKGSLLGFKAVEPMWTTPYAYNSLDPIAPDWYKPTAWYILGKRTHATRLLTFVSREVPDMLKPSYNFGGMSLSQLMEPYVSRWLKTVDGVNRIINNFSIIALATNLQATLAGDETGADLLKRAELFIRNRDNQGLMLLDKDSEELNQIAVPLSGLHELQAQAQEHMAAPSHIPLVKLTGITPSGLNASSDGEIQVWYDFVKGMQELFFRPNLTTVLKLVQLHLYGEVDDSITVTFVPLEQMSAAELAQVRKSDADMDGVYITNGVVSPDEVRERLARDPASGYTGLKGGAPEPPDLGLMEHEHKLGEKSADNSQARSEESAEAAHKRDKETVRLTATAKKD